MQLFQLGEDNIVIYKNRTYKPSDYLLAAVILPVIIWCLFLDIPDQYRKALAIASIFIVPIVGLFLHQVKIVFDRNARTVYRQLPILGRMELISFDDINAIELVQIAGGLFGNKRCYCKISSKQDKFGKGTAILSNIKVQSDDMRNINIDLLPHLNYWVTESKSTVPQSAAQQHEGFEYMAEIAPGVYSLRSPKIASRLLWCIMFIACAWLITEGEGTNSNDLFGSVSIWLMGLLGLALLFYSTKRVMFDINTRTITSEYIGGSFRKDYSIVDYQRFHLTRHSLNFVYTGTGISIILKGGGNISVAQIYRTKKVEAILNEMTIILNRMV